MERARLFPQYKPALIVCLGGYAYGTALAWTSNITDGLENGVLNGMIMNYAQLSWAASAFAFGAMFSSLGIGFGADAKGRKFALLLTVIPFTVGWILILLSSNIYMICLGRFLTGLGGGGINVVAPMYTTEIAQTHLRGSFSIMVQLFVSLGVLHSMVLGWALPIFYFNVACMTFPVVFGLCFWFQPETPYYYLKKGKKEEAENSFKRLRGKEYDFSVELKYFNLEIEELKSGQNSTKFMKVLKTKSQIKATIICFMLMFFQQFSGIAPVLFYTKDIFINSSTPVPPYLGVIITGVVGLLGTASSVWLIDRIGRILLLNISAALCAVGAFLLGLFFTFKIKLDEDDVRKVSYFLPILATVIFLFGFNLGLGPIPWLTCSELLSVLIRAKLSSIIGAFHWLLIFLITKFYLDASEIHGIDNTFYIFMSISFGCILFVSIIIPEASHRTYVEVLPYLENFFLQ
ncbi:unnamed protein product [Psylliodes chrysocephalus]|uniref:Major facilitator superfamily (MFS) profile domain-containing protein n=1 Tax=Psylliodes chrysocephalus TaxID=3402493 RepID=A0A9P0D769_9CUCU|nr:unnamed protein product [Psylliodes chrysocephala]